MNDANVVQCIILVEKMISMCTKVLETIPDMVDLYIGSHPQIISVSVLLKVQRTRRKQKIFFNIGIEKESIKLGSENS